MDCICSLGLVRGDGLTSPPKGWSWKRTDGYAGATEDGARPPLGLLVGRAPYDDEEDEAMGGEENDGKAFFSRSRSDKVE